MNKKVDLIGKVFDRLTVLKKDYEKSNKHTFYLCKCSCGNIKSIRSSELIRGYTRSCGCLRKELARRKRQENIKDLRGKRFGRLIAVEQMAYRDKHNKILWQCLCDCGQYTIVNTNSLCRKNTKSCGCLAQEKELDLVGKKFGRLLVIEETDQRNNFKEKLWKCQCECGTIKYISSNGMIQGRTLSCGCYNKEIITGKNNFNYSGYKEISGTFWSGVKSNAKKRNIILNINIEQAYDLFESQGRKCAISGIDLKFSHLAANLTTYQEGNASLDRINSLKDYSIDNVQWVDKDINICKWNMPQEYFLFICKSIDQYLKQKYNNDEYRFFLNKHLMNIKNFRGYGELSLSLFNKIKKRALEHKRDFDISIKELWYLFVQQNGKCNYTGWDLYLPQYDKGGTASLDRIDSTKGYILGNVQWVYKTVNTMKWDYSEDKFLSMCSSISLYQKTKDQIV